MNIYLHELKNLKLVTIIWTLVIIIILSLFIGMYPLYYSNKDEVLVTLQTFSKESLLALGIDSDTLFTPIGFYSFSLAYIAIGASLHAGFLGFKIMISDNLEGATEFLLTKPMPRKLILNSKLAAGVTVLLISHILYQIISIILLLIIKGSEEVIVWNLIKINIGLFLLQLTFLTICMTIGAYIKKPSTIMLFSVSTILAFYGLSIIEKVLNSSLLRYVNPFSYFRASDILINGGYKQSFVIATIFIIFFCLNFSYGCYENDDILED